MFLGRIITNSKNLVPLDFIEKTGVLEVDKRIPTLIIGRANAEKIYGKDKIHILNKEIEPNVYWTFGKTERRVDYEDDLSKFYENVIKKLQNRVKYQYFNIFTEDKGKICSFIDWLYNGGKKYVYILGTHIYLFYFNSKFSNALGTQTVYGISLNDVEYIGKNKDSVIEKIKNNPNNIIIDNTDFISFQFMQRISNSNMLIPYLYFLNKE